jgi:hypothetical protein
MRHGGEWGTGRGRRHAAVKRCSVAGSGPDAALTCGARPMPKQGKEGAGRCAPATVLGGGGLNILQIQTNSNYLKTFRTLTDPKTTLPSPKK